MTAGSLALTGQIRKHDTSTLENETMSLNKIKWANQVKENLTTGCIVRQAQGGEILRTAAAVMAAASA